MGVGLYCFSIRREGSAKKPHIFGNMAEIEHALNAKAIDLHTKIKYRWNGLDEKGKPTRRWFDTTAGRVMLGNVLPKSPKISYEPVNKLMTKRAVSNTIHQASPNCRPTEAADHHSRLTSLA